MPNVNFIFILKNHVKRKLQKYFPQDETWSSSVYEQ